MFRARTPTISPSEGLGTPRVRGIPPLLSVATAIAALVAATALPAHAQSSSGGGVLGSAPLMSALVTPPAAMAPDAARATCPVLIASSVAAYEIQGPHGDQRLDETCTVREYQALGRAGGAAYAYGRYRVTSVFTAEDPGRGPQARDTVPEEVVVLFRSDSSGQSVAVWQMRYEVGPYGALRSITPNVADDAGSGSAVLLSVEACVNGTGGCGQEFLHFRRGAWALVDDAWWRQLPADVRARILHGVHIDPRTLRAEGGIYRDTDPNCCPSDLLRAQLRLVGDALVLVSHQIGPQPR